MRVEKAGKRAYITGFDKQIDLARFLADRRTQLCYTKLGKGHDAFNARAFANKIKVDRSTVTRLESAERWPSFQTLKKYLDGVGLELAIVAKPGAEPLDKI